MSYLNQKDSTAPYTGFDAAIQSIREETVALEFVVKAYHRAYLIREVFDGKTKRIPKVWEKKNEYINVLPNDNLASMLFFYPTSEENVITEEDPANNIYDRNCSLIFWCNVNLLDNHLTGPSLSLEKSLLLETLTLNDSVVEVFSIEDNDVREVFKEFTLDDKYMMLPFAAIRINFKVKFEYPCSVS